MVADVSEGCEVITADAGDRSGGLLGPQAVDGREHVSVTAPEPALGFSTLYDHWRGREKGNLFSYSLGSPSEHWSFYQMLGTPIVYMMWEIDFARWSWNDFPLYHTVYETFSAMAHLDPEFVYHQALGRLWAVLAQRLAQQPLLPIDVRDVEKPLRLGLDHIRRSYGQLMDRHNVSLGGLERAVQRYVTAAQRFHKKIISRTDYSDLELRQINDQMVGVERSFVDPNGLLVDEQNRNAVFGTDPDHEYNGVLFPDVVETLLQVSEQSEQPDLWQCVRRALAAAIFVVNGAAASLADPSHFVRPWPETEPDQTLTRN
ncbi:putative N-acetylated-alpha-linked acidic dipeptidase [Pollicipes pollicipes]|uniref:putative N-acetylated-alpha-linked acidic dipeptidase n=1 Tax=Pollicipes pollicipes TaxID=41117 RepID=UPI001884DC4B|nr:putative N-acetylated-alpha-linked acidic dipeptidase [Pollicipes pollicipes]